MQCVPVKYRLIINAQTLRQLLQLLADRTVADDMQHIVMSASFQLRAGLQQRIQPFGRHEAADGDQLGDFIIMGDRLKPFLVKPVWNNADGCGIVHIRRQVIGKRLRNGIHPVGAMLQLAVQRSKKPVLRPVLPDATVQDEFFFITRVNALDDRGLRKHFLHR
ncbi:hypothetical protein D3C81_1566750 [compost metagenome]